MKPTLVVSALALAACAAGNPPVPATPDAPASLAAAETAFAAHSVREDMRAAFLANFADDGVFVRKGWTLANASLKERPAPPIVLDWRPVYTEVAHSGELGLSTGPWKITSKEKPDTPATYGQFVSIWRRVGDGPWRVEVDLGIGHPDSQFWDAPLKTRFSPESSYPNGSLADAEGRFALAGKDSSRAAYAKLADDDIRLYRNGTQPIYGKRAAVGKGPDMEKAYVWTVDRSEVARSQDFGYARGSYASTSEPTKPLGYFLRVWHVDRGEWRIVLDVTNPAS